MEFKSMHAPIKTYPGIKGSCSYAVLDRTLNLIMKSHALLNFWVSFLVSRAYFLKIWVDVTQIFEI